MVNRMPYLSPDQIAGYATAAGCVDPQIPVAIAMAESGGNPLAHNPIPPDDSYGLWQVNMIGNLGPSRRSQFGLSTNSQLYDPATNARAMYAISSGCRRWSPWTTYTSGAYRKFLNTSLNPPDTTSGLPAEPTSDGVLDTGGQDTGTVDFGSAPADGG